MFGSIKHLFALPLFLLPFAMHAQEFLWKADLLGFFDNREYGSPYQQSQTLFGTRLSPEVGVGIDDNRHRLMVGASWVQPIGASFDEGLLRPTVYYRFCGKSFQMSFGAFPRTQLIAPQPDFMVYDSLLYFRPNIQGALFQYSNSNGYIEAYIDWRGKQTETRREAFLISGHGLWHPDLWLLGGDFQMNHLARTKYAPETVSVIDDLLLHPFVGVNLSEIVGVDSLSLKSGCLVSMQRNRGIGTWHRNAGVTADVVFEWRWFGLKNFFYAGGGVYPLYPQFGSELNQGDPYYQAKVHNTTRVYAYLFRNPYVNCLASFNIHCNQSKIDLQQQLIVRFAIDNFTAKRKPAGFLRSIL